MLKPDSLEDCPQADQEVAITRGRDEDSWTLDVSDRRTVHRLMARGWEPFAVDGPYARFKLPVKAIAFRSRKAVDGAAERAKAMKGSADRVFGPRRPE